MDKLIKQKIEQRKKDFDVIRTHLGINFDNHFYLVGKDPRNIQEIPKTLEQLRQEYFKLIRLLDSKLDNGQISEEDYETIYKSLDSIFKQYKEELNNKKSSQKENWENVSEVIPDITDRIDEDLLQDNRFLKLAKLYNLEDFSEKELEEFIRKYKNYLEQEEYLEQIDFIEETDRIL